MMGSFLSRAFLMILGYVYPAYECYKAVEKNKPEIEHLRFWCQYWILVAILTAFERFGEAFISWLPMYSEAKLVFFVYLWYPKTKGTMYVYDTFFRPYVAKHETEIDRSLLNLKTRVGDMAFLCWQKGVSYGQTRIFEILKYVSSQSLSVPNNVQQQQQQQQIHEPTTSQPQEQPAPAHPNPIKIHPQDPRTTGSSSPSPSKPLTPSHRFRRSAENVSTTANGAQAVRADAADTSATAASDSEVVSKEAVHKTRDKLRKRTAISGTSTH